MRLKNYRRARRSATSRLISEGIIGKLSEPDSKYGSKRTIIDGLKFDSKREAKRYVELKTLLDAGKIRNLELHPKWFFKQGDEFLKIRSKGYPNGRKVSYAADFSYVDLRTTRPKVVVEDVKGMDTDASRLRRALMELFHGIRVEIVK